MGVLSQNSDFINHLLGCQSLCSKLKKKKKTTPWRSSAAVQDGREPQLAGAVLFRDHYVFADWLTRLGTALDLKSETLLLELSRR